MAQRVYLWTGTPIISGTRPAVYTIRKNGGWIGDGQEDGTVLYV